MRKAIKSLAFRVAPIAAGRFFAGRHRRHNERVTESAGLPRVADAVVRQYGGIVAAGPFAGMRYAGTASGSTTAPKVLGSYEAEIAPWVEQLCRAGFGRIIDVGCAEGYYAVGMALRCPSAEVIAFDVDRIARQRCVELARAKGVVGRISVRTACGPQALSEAVVGKTLVICDTEGYEQTLLDPVACPGLRRATVLVELHEAVKPGVTQLLERRFRATHLWAEVQSRHRRPADFPRPISCPSQTAHWP